MRRCCCAARRCRARTGGWPKPANRRATLPCVARSALEAHLEQHAHETAALIVEPLVQGATGMAMYDAEYLRRARALCDRYEVHLIADEIMIGFGRSGTFFAHEQAGIVPDFLCLSKGITGGYLPLAAVMTTDRDLSRPSTTNRPRAASCIRTRIPATRWPAAPRWPRSIYSPPTT